MEITKIDHKAYQAKTRKMTVAELQFTMRDASEAMKAVPDGHKAGYYADEVHYCGMELRRRNVEDPENWMIPIFCQKVAILVALGLSEENAKQAVKDIMKDAVDLMNAS